MSIPRSTMVCFGFEFFLFNQHKASSNIFQMRSMRLESYFWYSTFSHYYCRFILLDPTICSHRPFHLRWPRLFSPRFHWHFIKHDVSHYIFQAQTSVTPALSVHRRFPPSASFKHEFRRVCRVNKCISNHL